MQAPGIAYSDAPALRRDPATESGGDAVKRPNGTVDGEQRQAEAAVVIISVLGPFQVDGDGSSLGPRDRVVLEVLVLRPGVVVSAERLADAMWGDLVPPTWNKVVQGCVVRLRKVLGSKAIETSPAGYRLTTPPDAVDAHRFERLARRCSELLALGDFDRAAYVGGQALALWRGPALRELEGWDAGRIEAGRLEELRLGVEEIRLEAALRAGHHQDVLAEAQARAAEAPLRERRWALLALAQYQAGRQGDALRTLHQARSVLVSELGVEPGAELIALEQAILRQDPSLVAAAALPEPGASCPYLGLVPYDVADADGFFGREREVEACLGRLAAVGVLVVVGPSGGGKSSLVRAGVAASLERRGRLVVVITPGARPMDALIALPVSGSVPVLVVDQCEEAITLCDDQAARVMFFSALAAHARRGQLVIALRADRLGELSGHPDFAALMEPGLHLLSAMSEPDLRAAIEGPARQVGLLLEPGLVDLLVREVEGEAGALPLLSHALHETWQRREGRTLTVEGYQATGGIRGSVAQSAEEIYHQLPDEQRPYLRDLLLRLVTPTHDGEPVLNRVPIRTVATDAEHEHLVEVLIRARLVTSDDDTVELAHESLARAWPRLRTWLDDDVDGQRILRHLWLAAEAWDGMGRPDSELYRGVRLAQALDWQTSANPDLTPAEATFLDTSTERERAEAESGEQRLRHQARQNRRLRALLAGVALLLVAAVFAGLLAVRQGDRADRAAIAARAEAERADQAAVRAEGEAQRADRAATAADARRVGAQALLVDDIDHSLLLAVEGVRLDDSIDTRANLLAALSRSPELIGSTRTDGPDLISVGVSPDGETVGVGHAYGAVSFYDTSTKEQLGTYGDTPIWKWEYRPDGGQLAASGQPGPSSGSVLAQPSVRLVDPATFEDEPAQLGGIPASAFVSAPHYSADGRFLGATFEESDGGNDSSVAVWDLSSPEEPVLRFDLPGIGYELDLSPDGTLLYVGRADPPALGVYEVATGQLLRSASVPAAWMEVSPDGSLLAIAGGTDVVLLDATTLAEVRRLRGHSEWVQTVRFSPSGALLASGSDDRTAIVWDVATGTRRELLRGSSTDVWGVAFSPDEGTLYSSSGPTVLTWDLVGDRRFVPRGRLPASNSAPISPAVEGAFDSPTGEATAFTGCPTVDGPAVLQFVDNTTNQALAPIDTGHRCYGWFAWRPDGQRFATTGDDGFVRIWDWRTGQLVAERHVAPEHVSGLDYTRDGQRIVVTQRSGTTYALDADTLEADGPPAHVEGEIVQLYASPDNHTAIVLTSDRFVHVDLDTGEVIHQGEADFDLLSGAFSPDGRRFAVGGSDGAVRVLDVATGQWVAPPTAAHAGSAFVSSAGDSRFVSGGADGAIILWDADTGAPGDKLPGPSTGVGRVGRMLPDGHTVRIASPPDWTVETWDTRLDHWIDVACSIAGRNLTEGEWNDAFPGRPYHQTCP
jgi:WD40 repeat protein/DNA-binding SARP family transcriptional activator